MYVNVNVYMLFAKHIWLRIFSSCFLFRHRHSKCRIYGSVESIEAYTPFTRRPLSCSFFSISHQHLIRLHSMGILAHTPQWLCTANDWGEGVSEYVLVHTEGIKERNWKESNWQIPKKKIYSATNRSDGTPSLCYFAIPLHAYIFWFTLLFLPI